METQLRVLCSQLSIAHPEAENMAMENVRIAETKIGVTSLSRLNLHRGNLLAVGLDIACKFYGINIERAKLAKITGMNGYQYTRCVNAVWSALGMAEPDRQDVLKRFAVMNNCAAALEPSEKIFELCCQNRMMACVPEMALRAACFAVSATELHMGLSIKALSDIHRMSPSVFKRLLLNVHQRLKEHKAKGGDDLLRNDTTAESTDDAIESPVPTKCSSMLTDYESWKENMLATFDAFDKS